MTPVRRLLVFIASALAMMAVVGQFQAGTGTHTSTEHRTELAATTPAATQVVARDSAGKANPLLFVALVLGAVVLGSPRRHAISVVVRRESLRLRAVAHCISRRGPPRLLVSN